MTTRPTWAEISRSHLLANYAALREAAPAGATVMAVVKGDAYGHGALACAPLLAGAGAEWLGVTSAEEGVRVRAVCPGPRILLMSGLWAGEAGAILENGLTPSVWEPFHLDLLEAEAAAQGLSPGSVPVHLEIDTGMSRQGAAPEALPALLGRFGGPSPLRLEAVMTHFASPEILDGEPNFQMARFAQALEIVHAQGPRPEMIHAGSSATLLAGPDRETLTALAAKTGARLMLRPGLALYGCPPQFVCCGGAPPDDVCGELRPVLAWKARVTSLRTIARGETAGYGRTFTAKRETRLALLPVGYADGLSRALSNRGHVLIRGRRAPVAGRISMDQTMVDVTEIPGAAPGDEAVLIGEQAGERITAWDDAVLAGTIAYETLCAIGARVPRVLVP